jgi:hypothetical protein
LRNIVLGCNKPLLFSVVGFTVLFRSFFGNSYISFSLLKNMNEIMPSTSGILIALPIAEGVKSTSKEVIILRTFITAFCIIVALMFGSTAVQAVPSLGVGTGTFDCAGASEYWECFSGNLGGHGFALPDSGGTVTPFTRITGADIWLLAEPSIGSFTFTTLAGTVYNSDDVLVGGKGAFSSYDTSYEGVNLQEVGGNWTEIASSLYNPDTFYMLPGTFTYSGTDVEGDWLFLVADIGNDYPPLMPSGGGHDRFSPKTTSAVGNGNHQVPEPGTLLLLGAGLLGLPLLQRKI